MASCGILINSVDTCSCSNFACGGCKGVVEVELTDVGKRWVQDHYPQGIVWEHDPDKPLKLHAITAEYIEFTHQDVPYRIPPEEEGKPTIKKVVY